MLCISLFCVKFVRKYFQFRINKKWKNNDGNYFREEMVLGGLVRAEMYIESLLKK